MSQAEILEDYQAALGSDAATLVGSLRTYHRALTLAVFDAPTLTGDNLEAARTTSKANITTLQNICSNLVQTISTILTIPQLRN